MIYYWARSERFTGSLPPTSNSTLRSIVNGPGVNGSVNEPVTAATGAED